MAFLTEDLAKDPVEGELGKGKVSGQQGPKQSLGGEMFRKSQAPWAQLLPCYLLGGGWEPSLGPSELRGSWNPHQPPADWSAEVPASSQF